MFAEVPVAQSQVYDPAISDDVIGIPGKSYKDPEYWVDGNKVTWQDEDDSIWLAAVDRNTGLMIPADGRGHFLGIAVPIEGGPNGEPGSWNGPEWGFSKQGPAVYFTGRDSNGVHQVMRYRVSDDSTRFVTQGGQVHRSGPLPSKNPEDANTAIMTFMGRFRNNIGTWRYEDEPTADKRFPSEYFATSGPQWINGEPAIATNLVDSSGYLQVVKYDVTTGDTLFITRDAGDKFDTYFFRAPEYGNAKMFLVTRALEKPNQTIPSVPNEIAIYMQSTGETYLPCIQMSLHDATPSEQFNHWSAEPFVYKGKTYLSCAVMQAGGTTYQSPSDIYIMSIDGKMKVKVNRHPQDRVCIDPESFPTDSLLFIYYYSIESGGKRNLHRSKIFIPDSVASTEVERIPDFEDRPSLDVFPNPTGGSFTLRTVRETDVRITDLIGREVWRGRIGGSTMIDAAGWMPGVYVLHTDTRVIQIVKMNTR